MTKKPEAFSRKLGLHFRDVQLFTMALTHRSAGVNNNERLEYLGDSVLGFVIAQKLYETFPDANEGVLSRLRASLVNQETLAEIARDLDIGSHLIMGSGELKSGGYRRDSILSDALESIIGAVLKDQGVAACQDWVLHTFADKLEQLSLDNWQKDPKTQLQEYMQSLSLELPEYTLISQTGLAHSQTFEIECSIPMLYESTSATGSSRKRTEQAAAQAMLIKLEEQGKLKK